MRSCHTFSWLPNLSTLGGFIWLTLELNLPNKFGGYDEWSLLHGFSSKPYIHVYYKNGRKDRSGHPIFSTMIADKNRGIRIFQTTVEEA